MKTVIHVNQHKIRKNIKAKKPEPVLTIKTYKSNDYGFEAEITGPSRIVYRPDNPLSCGARVWVETFDAVIVVHQPRRTK
jgi:hypothetical protein